MSYKPLTTEQQLAALKKQYADLSKDYFMQSAELENVLEDLIITQYENKKLDRENRELNEFIKRATVLN